MRVVRVLARAGRTRRRAHAGSRMPSSWQRPYRAQLTTRQARAALKSSPFASQRAASAEPLGLELRVVHVRVDLEAKPQLREVRTDARSLVARSIRQLDRLGQRAIGFLEAPSPQQGVAEVAEELRASRIVGRHQRQGSGPELDAGVGVPARGGGPSGRRRGDRPRVAPAPPRARRSVPARRGSDVPARGASRRSRRTRPGGRRRSRSSQSAKRACRSARDSLVTAS